MEIMVVKEFTFDAAHCLPHHPGKCRNTHGHTYRLQVGFRGPVSIQTGMVVDFGELKALINQEIISKLDHRYLNLLNEEEPIVEDFPYYVPTAENMVKWIVKSLQRHFWDSFTLVFVRLYETPTSYAEWRKKE